MAAKTPAAKKTAKSVKSSKTAQAKAKTTAKTTYTAAQKNAYNAASAAAIKMARTTYSNTLASANNAAYAARRRTSLGAQLAKQRAMAGQFQISTSRAYAAKLNYLQAKSYNPANRALIAQATRNLSQAVSVASQTGSALQGQMTYSATYRNQQFRQSRGKIAAASTRKAFTTRTGPKVPNYKAIGARAGKSAVHAVPKTRKAAGSVKAVNPEWVTAGNDDGEENCVAVAIANHLLYHTGYRVPDGQVQWLGKFRYGSSIERALARIDYEELWRPAALSEYGMVPTEYVPPGMVIGFESENGPHCGLLLPGNMVVSWGEVVPLEAEIEEAWEVAWMKTA